MVALSVISVNVCYIPHQNIFSYYKNGFVKWRPVTLHFSKMPQWLSENFTYTNCFADWQAEIAGGGSALVFLSIALELLLWMFTARADIVFWQFWLISHLAADPRRSWLRPLHVTHRLVLLGCRAVYNAGGAGNMGSLRFPAGVAVSLKVSQQSYLDGKKYFLPYAMTDISLYYYCSLLSC